MRKIFRLFFKNEFLGRLSQDNKVDGIFQTHMALRKDEDLNIGMEQCYRTKHKKVHLRNLVNQQSLISKTITGFKQ